MLPLESLAFQALLLPLPSDWAEVLVTLQVLEESIVALAHFT